MNWSGKGLNVKDFHSYVKEHKADSNLSLIHIPVNMICSTSSESIIVQYESSTSVICKLKVCSAQTLSMDYKVKWETYV